MFSEPRNMLLLEKNNKIMLRFWNWNIIKLSTYISANYLKELRDMYTYYHIFSWVGDEQLKKDKPSESCRSISAEKNPLNLLSWLYSHWSSLEIYRSRLFNFTFKLIIRVIVINFVKNCPCCLKAYILVFIMWIKKSFYVSSEYRVVFLSPLLLLPNLWDTNI